MKKPRSRKKKRDHRSGRQLFNKQYSPPGTAPGTLLPHDIGAQLPVTFRVIDYDAENLEEVEGATVERCRASLQDPSITWVAIQGQVTPEVLKSLGDMFTLHPLALEDVINWGQRPKAEVYGDDLFVVMGAPRHVDDTVVIDQVSLFLGKNYVISIFGGEGPDVFEPVRKRLKSSTQRFRSRGADFLFYALADVVVDLAFPVLEALGDQIDAVEIDLADDQRENMLHRIHDLKREVVLLRRHLWPQRELISQLAREQQAFFTEETQVYLRDVFDHAVQTVDLLENFREMCASLLEVHLSSMSHRLNEAMRVLTVISTIFIPLSFLVGVYGMNFDFMPELHQKWGYPAVWVIIFSVAVTMLIFFRRRDWI